MTRLLSKKTGFVMWVVFFVWTIGGISIASAQACGEFFPNGCPQGQICVHESFGVEFCSADPSFQGCTGPNPTDNTRVCVCTESGDAYAWTCTARNVTPNQCLQPQPNVGRACSCVFSGGSYVWDCGPDPAPSGSGGTVVDIPEVVVETSCTSAFCPLSDVSGSKLQGLYAESDSAGDNLSVFIGKLFGFALAMGAVLAILRIAWGGYLYMTTDLWSSKEHAREVLRETILGLLLLLAVYIILRQINPDILELNLQITPLPEAGEAQYIIEHERLV